MVLSGPYPISEQPLQRRKDSSLHSRESARIVRPHDSQSAAKPRGYSEMLFLVLSCSVCPFSTVSAVTSIGG